MSQNKKLMDETIRIKQQRDHAEKQMIAKIQEFAKMQMQNEVKRKQLLASEARLGEERKVLAQEQKRLKKLLSSLTRLQGAQEKRLTWAWTRLGACLLSELQVRFEPHWQ